MKQKITFFKVLLTLVLLCGVGNAWGASRTIIVDAAPLTSTATTESKEFEFGGVTFVFSDGAKQQKSNSATNAFTDEPAILIGKSGKYIYNKTAIPGTITKFEIYSNFGASSSVTVGVNFSSNVISSYNANASNTYAAKLGQTNVVYDCSSNLPNNAKYFWFQVTNSNNAQVQFRITYEEPPTNYTLTWNNNGNTTSTTCTNGELTLPSNPSAPEGYAFMGWTTASSVNADGSDIDYAKNGDAVSGDEEFYAVYAKKKGDLQEVTNTMDFSDVTYSDWTVDKAINRTQDQGTGGTGDYAGKINTNDTYITFNEKVKITSFGFSFKRTSSNSNYKVYIETSIDNKNWTTRQEYPMTDFGNGSYTTKTDGTFTGNEELYVRFHCSNTTATRYVDDVVIKYISENYIYSAYCTTIPKTQSVIISEAGYATAYIPFAATVEGATAYYVTVSGDKAQLNEIEGTIPANTGVVLKGAEGTATFTESAEAPTTDVSANKMVGTLTTETFSDKDFVYYRLANNNGSVGFYKQNADGSAECAAGKAVLAVPASAVAPTSFTFDDATAINAISNVKTSGVRYNLNGQAVGEDYKGIVIVNGKKMFNK